MRAHYPDTRPPALPLRSQSSPRREGTRATCDELAERVVRRLPDDGVVEAAPGLFLSRVSAPTGPIYRVSDPSFCVVAQGSKEILLGAERFRYDTAHYLLVSAGLPLVGHVVDASRERPYLGVRVVLDPAVVTSVLVDAGVQANRLGAGVRALAVEPVSAILLEAVVRLVRLLDSSTDYRVLAPLVIREIIYRLATSEQDGRLLHMVMAMGREHRVSRAIELIRRDYAKPLRVGGLARTLGMSVSGFHQHFKAATALSPLQFQKQLRLQEARRLLVAGDFDAATAGYQVGYDDPSHFSRDYKRLFGEPPMRDIGRLRASSPDR